MFGHSERRTFSASTKTVGRRVALRSRGSPPAGAAPRPRSGGRARASARAGGRSPRATSDRGRRPARSGASRLLLAVGRLVDRAAQRLLGEADVDLLLGLGLVAGDEVAERRVALVAERACRGSSRRARPARTSRTCFTGSFAAFAISSSVGAARAPRSARARRARSSARARRCAPGSGSSRDLFATPRCTAWRIHQVA